MTALRPMAPEDLMSINPLLVRAFTQARRDDGYAKPEIPLCTTEFLRFYYEDSPSACWVVTREQHIIGAVFGHCWGATGWIGPLAVTPEWQHQALGQALMAAALDSLHKAGCSCIGLETSPRSARNLAFYARLGLVTGPLMCDMALSLKERTCSEQSLSIQAYSQHPGLFSRMRAPLIDTLDKNMDYLHLARHLRHWAFGETYLLSGAAGSEAVAAVQHAMISSREMRGVARVLSLVACRALSLDRLVAFLLKIAESAQSNYITLRIPAHQHEIIRDFLTRGWRIVQTHIRMYERGFMAPHEQDGIHLNKWD